MIALIGDNSTVHNETEKLAHFGHEIQRVLAKRADARLAKQHEKEILADFKNDGGDPRLMLRVIKAIEDGDGMLKKHELDDEALRLAGRIGGRGKDLLDRVDQEEVIFAKGRMAGLIGLDCVSGYDAGSSDDKLWINGWKEGQRIVLEEWVSANAKIQRKRGVVDDLPDDPFESDL